MTEITRRASIRKTLGGAGVLALACGRGVLTRDPPAWASLLTLPATAKPSSSIVGGLQIGCMTWSFRKLALAEALKSIAEIGFSTAELWSGHLDPLKASDDELIGWKTRFTNAGVKLTSYFVDVRKDSSDEQINRCFETGGRLGVSILSGNLNKTLLPRIDRACQKHKLYVGLHNEVYNPRLPSEVVFAIHCTNSTN